MNASDITVNGHYAIRDQAPVGYDQREYKDWTRPAVSQLNWREVKVLAVTEVDSTDYGRHRVLIEAVERVGFPVKHWPVKFTENPEYALRSRPKTYAIPQGCKSWLSPYDLYPLDKVRAQEAIAAEDARIQQVLVDAGLLTNPKHRSPDRAAVAAYVVDTQAELDDLRARVCRADEIIEADEAEQAAVLERIHAGQTALFVAETRAG